MFLFIFESIGTSELILIGIIALIFLGPRKLPEIARKMGKIMAEFRNTTNEFKQTWEREVNFEEEAKALRDFDVDPVPQFVPPSSAHTEGVAIPEIKQVDASAFSESLPKKKGADLPDGESVVAEEKKETGNELSDKKNWL